MQDKKKALKRDYLSRERDAGIFRIVNLETGRTFVGSSLDMNAALNRFEFELSRGSCRNRELQEDFDRLGKDAFSFERAERLDGVADDEIERELEILEERWAAGLDAERYYNSTPDLRVPPRRRRRAEPV